MVSFTRTTGQAPSWVPRGARVVPGGQGHRGRDRHRGMWWAL